MVETRAPYILEGNILPFILATVFFSGRVWARSILRRFGSWDDVFLSLGWACAFANCIMACLLTRYGGGLHMKDIPFTALGPSLQCLYGTLIVYQLSLCFTKLSLCSLYLKVFTTSYRGRIFLYAIVAFVCISTIICEGVSIFQCSPVKGVYDIKIKSKCIDTIPAFYTSTVENILVDILLMVFAVPKIMRLKMVARQKYALLFTVGLGSIPVIVSIIRAVRVSSVLHAADKTWVSFDSSIWSAVDANVSIICASVPALKPLFKQITPKLIGSSYGSSSQPDMRYGSTRKSWLDRTFNSKGGFELHSSPKSSDNRGFCQVEVASSPARSSWTIKEQEEDTVSDGSSLHGPSNITKSVTVAVTSVQASP